MFQFQLLDVFLFNSLTALKEFQQLLLSYYTLGPTSLDEVALAVQRALGTVLASACWDPRFRPSCLLGFRSTSEVNRLRQLQASVRNVPVLFDFCNSPRPVTYLARFVPPFISPIALKASLLSHLRPGASISTPVNLPRQVDGH